MVCMKAVMHIMSDRVTRSARRRRDHSPELKRELVARSLLPGASVSAIALEAGINANLLFTWRRAYRTATGQVSATSPTSAVLLPVTIETAQDAELIAHAPTAPAARANTGTIEIDIGGARIRLRGVVDEATVRCVLQSLRATA